MLVGGFDVDMGQEGKLIFFPRIILNDLGLISLAFVAAVTGVGIGGVLQRIGGDILVRPCDGFLCLFVFTLLNQAKVLPDLLKHPIWFTVGRQPAGRLTGFYFLSRNFAQFASAFVMLPEMSLLHFS